MRLSIPIDGLVARRRFLCGPEPYFALLPCSAHGGKITVDSFVQAVMQAVMQNRTRVKPGLVLSLGMMNLTIPFRPSETVARICVLQLRSTRDPLRLAGSTFCPC